MNGFPSVARRKAWPIGALLPAVLLTACTLGPPSEVGSFGGPGSGAAAINRAGVVVGWADTVDAGRRAFRANRGGPLLALDGAGDVVDPDSEATAINDRGDIAGRQGHRALVRHPDGRTTTVPFPALEGLVLPPEPTATARIGPTGINGTGVVIGRIEIMGGSVTIPVVFDPATGRTTVLLTGAGNAWAINDGGRIVGEDGTRPVVWSPDGRGGWGPPEHLPLPEGWSAGTAYGLNDRGDIVGDVLNFETRRSRAVVWRGPSHAVTVIDTGAADARARDINNAGTVVGEMNFDVGAPTWRTAAFSWQPGAPTVTELPGLANGHLTWATAVNDAGAVIGGATTQDNPHNRAVRWDPTSRLPPRAQLIAG